MRIAHTDTVHVVERIANVVDARPAHSDALRHQPRAAVQIELAHVGRVRGVGDEGKRANLAPRRKPDRNQPRLVDAARHLAVPQARERAPQPARVNAVRHSPARAAAAQPHDQAGLALRAAVARGQYAERAVVAVRPAGRLVLVVEARRPHERAVAEHPEVALGQQVPELAEPHGGKL
jgi:hypothetical protein